MVPVFIGGPSKPCSKTMNCDGSGRRSGAAPLSGAGRLAGASEEALWWEYDRTWL